MADKDKYSFIVVKYPKKDTADAALKAVLGLAKEKVVKLRDAVVITKTDKGKIKLHQTKDDATSKGLLKGGGIGVIFALLFGPAGWIVAGAALGGAFATFDRGIKNKLLKELGENMTPEQSAMAVLVEEADWETALGRMADLNLQGEVIVQEMEVPALRDEARYFGIILIAEARMLPPSPKTSDDPCHCCSFSATGATATGIVHHAIWTNHVDPP